MGALVEPGMARSRPGLVFIGALPADCAANRRPRPRAPCGACAQLRYDAVHATTTQPDAAIAVLRHAPDLASCLRIGDRKSVVEGKSVSVRVDLGGRRIIKKKNTQEQQNAIPKET